MEATVAAYRAAAMLAVLLMTAAVIAPEHPEAVYFLASARANPLELASVLIMIALGTAQAERRE